MPDNFSCRHERIEGFSYDLDMKTRKQNRKKQTNEKRAIWMVYRTDTNARGFWSVKRTLRWKNFMPEELSRNQSILRFDVIPQHDWPINQCLLLIRIFSDGKVKRPFFYLFIYGLIKQITNTYRNHNQGHTKISPSGEVWTETAQNWNKSFTHFKHRIPERLADSFVH